MFIMAAVDSEAQTELDTLKQQLCRFLLCIHRKSLEANGFVQHLGFFSCCSLPLLGLTYR